MIINNSLNLKLVVFLVSLFTGLKAPFHEIAEFTIKPTGEAGPLDRIIPRDTNVTNASFCPNSRYLAILTNDHQLIIIDTETEVRLFSAESETLTWGQERTAFRTSSTKIDFLPNYENALKWSPNGQFLAISGQNGDIFIFIINPALEFLRKISLEANPYVLPWRNPEYFVGFDWLSDDQLVGVIGNIVNKVFSIIHFNKNNELRRTLELTSLQGHEASCSCVFNRRTSRVAFGLKGAEIKVLDFNTAQIISEFSATDEAYKTENSIKELNWVMDGNSLVVSRNGSDFSIINLEPLTVRSLPWNLSSLSLDDLESPDYKALGIENSDNVRGNQVITSPNQVLLFKSGDRLTISEKLD